MKKIIDVMSRTGWTKEDWKIILGIFILGSLILLTGFIEGTFGTQPSYYL